MFGKLIKATLKLAPVALLPWANSQIDCFFWNKSGPKLQPNNIQNRVHTQVLVSNSPCQDRSDVLQLSSIDGYAAAVYDGHGGWQLSQLCSQVLLKRLDQLLKLNKQSIKDTGQLIKKSIEQAFLSVQKQFLDVATLSYQYGFGRAARVGSCALVCVVHNNKVYCGNVGDSLGLIVRSDSPMGFQQINRFLNADNPQQQQRLKISFPNEEDIFICKKPDKTSCYVKGRLQPTRSLGDFILKYAHFNNPKNYPNQMEYQSPIPNYTGFYINPIPQIKVFQINKSDKSIILASDGLWDMLGKQQVAQVFKNNPIATIPSILIEKSLQKAAEQSKLTVQEIKKIKQGKKRKIHDDITVVILDLEKQVK